MDNVGEGPLSVFAFRQSPVVPTMRASQRVRLIGVGGDGYGRDRQLRYDSRTTVEYQGRLYRPEDLDRGDQVRIQVRRRGNGEWLAERIVVANRAFIRPSGPISASGRQ